MDRSASCPSCRGGTYADDAFCSWCGERVQARVVKSGESSRTLAARSMPTAQRQFCESCHSPVLANDVYCATCGARCGVTQPTVERLADTWAKIPQQISEATGGKYEFVRELGRGGMGVVFMARDRELKRNVAIKVLSSNWLTDESMVARFQNEARTIASLNHESIVTVFDVGRAGTLHYFVMDYVEGVSLSRVLRTYGRLPIPVVEAIFYRVALALSHAHRPKPDAIIHRDVKPSNIMLDTEGHVVIMDFGISKVSERPSGLTSTGLVMGTPEYMSPEQCRGHTVTPQSDQYSLGTVVYAMLTGAPPFTGPFYQVLMAHQMEPVPSILAVRPDCSPALAAATERMLAKVPGERWPTLIEAVKALGLRPLGLDDPVLDQIGLMVREASDPLPVPPVPEQRTGDSRTPTSIRIVPQPGTMEVGDELALKATVLFQGGAEETRGKVAWGSTDPAIVRVDPSTGQLVAIGAGAAVVTASGSGMIGTVAVDVSLPRVAQLTIEPADMTVDEGSTVRLSAQAWSKRGLTLERPITWSSSDPFTASVTNDGLVTTKQPGTVRILAHCEGVDAATVLRVAPAPAQSWVEPAPEPAPEPVPEERWSAPTPAHARPWATATLESFSTAVPSAPEPESPGSLRVETSHEGVAIAVLQGTRMVALGHTPWTSNSLSAGDYRVMVRDPRYLPDAGAVTIRSGEEARVELKATLRPTRAPLRSYAIKAFVPLAVASVALLVWTLLKSEPGATQPAEMPIAEFEDHLAQGDVVGVRVQQGVLAVQLAESSDTMQVSLAGLAVQEILGRIAGRGVPIVAEGEGSVRLGAVRAGSGEAIPSATLSVTSMAGGCGPCPPERLAAGWYAIQSDTIDGRLDSFQMSSADGLYRAETLPPGAQVFVLAGAVFDLTATLNAPVPVDSGGGPPPPPTTGTIRVDRQGLPSSTLIFLDDQMMSGSAFTVSPGVHRLRANALNFQDDDTVVTVQAGAVTRPWRPTLVAIVVEPPPNREPERPAVPTEALNRIRESLGLAQVRSVRSEFVDAIRGLLNAKALADSLAANFRPSTQVDSLQTVLTRELDETRKRCQDVAAARRIRGEAALVCP